jgi:2-iminobutanoate/2-iminopropanoate deaminase
MGKKVITLPYSPESPYSPAIKAGDFIFVSGQVGYKDEAGKEIKGIEAQTRRCLENMKRVLSAAEASMNDVIKVTVFLNNASDFGKMNEVYRAYFPKEPPARSTVVTIPAVPNMLVEIECVAYVP